MAKSGHPIPHSCPSGTQLKHHLPSSYNKTQRTRSKRLFFSSSIFLLAFFIFLSSTFSSLTTEAAATARRGHSGTTILNKVHFLGGLGTAATKDITPLKSITTLDLLTGATTETVLTQGIYNHAGSTEPFGGSDKDLSGRIGVTFGQTTGGVSMGALAWVGPRDVSAAPNYTNSGPYAKQPLVARAGHTMVQYQSNNLWVFGGYMLPLTEPKQPTRDTPTFDYSSSGWSNQTKIGLFRFGHASAVASTDNILSCYGTIFYPPKEKIEIPTSDCVNFSIMKTAFTKTNMIFTNEADRITDGLIGHSLVASPVKEGTLYMFGGISEKGKYNQDLYILDTTNLPDIRITKVTPTDDMALVPSARTDHVAVAAGVREGFMIIHGGISGNDTMADGEPHFFHMSTNKWLDLPTFVERYNAQLLQDQKEVSAWVLIAGILAGVSVLGGCVGMYIWKGIRKDTAKRLEREAADRQSVISPDFAAMEAAAAENRKSGSGLSSKKGRTPHPIYGMTEEDDHSLSNGPFKSTSSLIQAENGTKKTKSKNQSDSTYQSNHSKPWVTEPASPGGTTLTENGSINGYYSSNSSQTPSRLNKKGSNASSQNSMATRNNNNSRPGAGTTSESYYNPRDLYVDEDDDSSITVSLASESSTNNMSPWTGPVRVSTDLAPPNPRFSRGAIPQAHRQLVDAIATGAASPMPPSYAFTSNRNSNGWDTSSPGGSLSSRDDEYHRRSVNSMQWVSFEPMDLAGRPESQLYDPLSHQQYQQQQRSANGGGGGLTVRNASMYRTSLTSQPITIPSSTQNNPRMSTFGGSNTSDTNTEDSGSYYGPGGKRISTALAARQQRRSIRNSQDSLNSANGRHHSYQQQQQQQMASSKEGEEEVFVTKVLPIITNKVTKPTLAKVVTQQRGSRIVVPSAGPLSDQRSPPTRPSEEGGGGLGIDFSGFSPSQDTYMSGYGTNGSAGGGVNSSNNPRRTSYQTRRTSNLNPNKSSTNSSRQQQRDSTNVILKMPPAPKHTDNNDSGGGNSSLNPRSRDQQAAAPGVRNSIMDVGQDLSGYF
ncbi:hypothetical protein BG015_003424 [Linnemannia schmuckeri]|uniref:Galactose oxidase n=1 Tax=Linnemannia schmuckeri TaxID=64567 RepID=A0A9P5V4L9_9FUNG|nr:hypothetical protein BG015_003424 [Linnemannia schmuckeri]